METMDIKKELKGDPIFAMSLSSKELFHSNFWAWLFERNIEYAKIFFPKIKNIAAVKREQKHRDISIWQSEINPAKDDYNHVLVIENKFKSIPKKEQLIRYQEDIEEPKTKKGNISKSRSRKFCGGVLTGLLKPDFIDDDDMENWEFKSYKEIGEGIVKTAEKFEKKGTEIEVFAYNLIVRYGNMIQELQDLLSDELNGIGETWNTSIIEDYEEIRLHDILGKLLAEKFAAYLNKAYLNKTLSLVPEVNNYKLLIESYYGQGGAGVDIRYVNLSNDLTLIGVQIEKNQYRICAQWPVYTKVNKKLDPKMTKPLFESLKGKNWFVEYDYKGKKNNKEKTEPKIIRDHANNYHETSLSDSYGGYCSYDNKKRPYTFLYQYWNIDDTSFKELCDNIQSDMDLAYEILKNYK